MAQSSFCFAEHWAEGGGGESEAGATGETPAAWDGPVSTE